MYVSVRGYDSLLGTSAGDGLLKNTKLTTKRSHSSAPMPAAAFRLSIAVLVPFESPYTVSKPAKAPKASTSRSKVLREDASLARTAKVTSHQIVVSISTGLQLLDIFASQGSWKQEKPGRNVQMGPVMVGDGLENNAHGEPDKVEECPDE